MSELAELAAEITAFRDARDWKQFHNAKDLAISLNLEAAELLEIFQWKSEADLAATLPGERQRLADELADVFYWTLLLSHDLGIDLAAALREKMQKNALKYPVDKARGSSRKSTEL